MLVGATIKRLMVMAIMMLAAPLTAYGEMAAPPDHPALLEETTFLDIREGGTSYRLEALIVRPAAAKGRLPVALLTHGKPRLPSELVQVRAGLMSRQARDLAYRGYLAVAVVRRGYGVSGGTPGQPTNAPFAKCNDADLRKYFSVEADDLERALRVVAARNDADASKVIAIGGSVGGGAAIALAARNPAGLKAVVNLAGAMRLTDASGNLACPQDLPIAALASFGSQTKIPSLWVYSENDSNFGADAAQKVHAAYVAQGGVATLKIAPSLQPNDGHHIFQLPAGRQHWLAALDPFLRAQGLPTWSAQQLDPLTKKFNIAASRRQWLEGYYSLYTPKVMVRAPNGLLNYAADTRGVEPALKAALEGCEKAAKMPCTPIMKNFEMVTAGN
jgi:dienelactone hydrolase